MANKQRPAGLYMELVLSLVKRDLKARYKESALGFFWSLLRPAFLTVVLWLVFEKILDGPFKTGIIPYWLHALVSVLSWNFLLGSVTEATHSIVANGNLLKKVPINAEVFPLAAILSNGVHFLLAMCVTLGVVAVVRPQVNLALLLVPLIAVIIALLALGIGMILSVLQVYYRDTGSALELLGMAWFYATPVIYPASLVYSSLSAKPWGQELFLLYLLNPACTLVIAMRRAILYDSSRPEIPDATLAMALAGTTLLALALVVLGSRLHRRMSGNFADEL